MNYQEWRERVHWQLHLSPGRVTSGERGREEGRERMGGRQRMQHVLISANKGVVSLFSLSIVSERPRRREVLAFCAAFVLWPAEWPSGKPEWAVGGAISSIKCHSVSSTGVYFLFICRMRDMDTSRSLSPLSPKLTSSRSSHRFVLCLCFPPLFSKLTSSYACMQDTFLKWENKQ